MSAKYASDISGYDDSFLEKTIRNRMIELSFSSIGFYLEYLEENPPESLLLLVSLNNFYSEFFRNPLTFLLLEQLFFPGIFSSKPNNKPHEVRIWSAGCASGQEPYSLAILADNYINTHPVNTSFRIFATDKSDKEIKNAIQGTYHADAFQKTQYGLIKKYFSSSGEFFSVSKSLKNVIDFSVFDLLDNDAGSPPASIYGDFDLVMCSNLLFYYSPVNQKIILEKIYNSLIDGGLFITGEAETGIVKGSGMFKQASATVPIFNKI